MGAAKKKNYDNDGLPMANRGRFEVRVRYDDSPENPLTEWENDKSFFLYTYSGGWNIRKTGYGDNEDNIPFEVARHAADSSGKELYELIRDEMPYSSHHEAREWYRLLKGYTIIGSNDYRLHGSAVLGVKNENLIKDGITCTPEEYLKSILETFLQWCNGDVYGFQVLTPAGDVLESCWGFYGEDECLDEGLSILDWELTPSTEALKDCFSAMVERNCSALEKAIAIFAKAKHSEDRLDDVPEGMKMGALAAIYDITADLSKDDEASKVTIALIEQTSESKKIHLVFKYAPKLVASKILEILNA